jgi:glycosyltransferase involved in cell wall biosynthesis
MISNMEKIAKVIIAGDTLRGEQANNINSLFNLFAPVIESFDVEVTTFISEANYQKDTSKWFKGWYESLTKDKESFLKDINLENSAVLGFELSVCDINALNQKNVPWINIEIHPIRFLNDLCFEVNTSFEYDLSSISIDDAAIKLQANSLVTRYSGSFIKSSKKLLILGQTPIDKSVYFDGEFKKIADYTNTIKKISSKFDDIYYRPHPYLSDIEHDKKLVDEFNLTILNESNFYKLISDSQLCALAAISSSALVEASYFGLETIYLESRARKFSDPIDYKGLIDNSDLWTTFLKKEKKHSGKSLSKQISDSVVRDAFCSWGFRTKSDDLLLEINNIKNKVELQTQASESEAKAQLAQALVVAEQAQQQVLTLIQTLQTAQQQTQHAFAKADQLEALSDSHLQAKQKLDGQLAIVQKELQAVHEANHNHWLQLEQTRKELHDVHQSNHHHWQLAEHRQQLINNLYSSTSWRITAPLRWPVHQVSLLRQHGIKSRIKAFTKRLLKRLVPFLKTRPRLKACVKNIAYRFRFSNKLISLIRNNEAASTLTKNINWKSRRFDSVYLDNVGLSPFAKDSIDVEPEIHKSFRCFEVQKNQELQQLLNYSTGQVVKNHHKQAVMQMIEAGYWDFEAAYNYLDVLAKNSTFNYKRKIYWFSPLPPSKSGVANMYAQQILPFLSLLFEIIVVTNSEKWDSNFFNLKICDLETFESDVDKSAIIINNIANNPMHTYMNEMRKTARTICIIHDVFVGNERYTALDGSFNDMKLLAKSEGYVGTARDVEQLIREHHYIKKVIKKSGAIIVHSDYAADLVEKNSDGEFVKEKNLYVNPLFRQNRALPSSKSNQSWQKRKKVVCFGNVSKHKLSKDVLLGFLMSKSFQNNIAEIIFAGSVYDDNYCNEMRGLVKKFGAQDQVNFTDYIDEARYMEIARQSSLAIQLRANSRGESSGAVIDCFSYLIPTIVNSHGPFKELDLREVYMLEEHPNVESISLAIDRLLIAERIPNLMKNVMHRNNINHSHVHYSKVLEKIIFALG